MLMPTPMTAEYYLFYLYASLCAGGLIGIYFMIYASSKKISKSKNK